MTLQTIIVITVNLKVRFVTNTLFSSRTYWLSGEKKEEVWLVDCGDINKVIQILPNSSKIIGVMLTHVHFDHIYGLNELIRQFPKCVVYTNGFGLVSLTDTKRNFSRYHTDVDDFVFDRPENVVVVDEGDKIELFEGANADVYFTPGHDESCLCYKVGENLFTGDAYIPGIKTVTIFPHSSKKKALDSDLRISSMVRGMKVWPGHTLNE